MTTDTEDADLERPTRVEKNTYRIDRMNREDKSKFEDEVTKVGGEYNEVSWRKTASESLRDIERAVDRLTGGPAPGAKATSRRAPPAGSQPVPAGVRTALTDRFGPVTDVRLVYATGTGVVVRAMVIDESDKGLRLFIVDGGRVREMHDVAKAVDGMAKADPMRWRDMPVEEIEGIGEAYGQRLRAGGIHAIGDLVDTDAKRVETLTGAAPGTVEAWYVMADLMRVKGIGKQFAELLQRSGIGSVEALASSDPTRLHDQIQSYMATVDATIQRAPITPERVQGWVEAANDLE